MSSMTAPLMVPLSIWRSTVPISDTSHGREAVWRLRATMVLRIARGRYVAFLDSDDLWMAEKTGNSDAEFMEQHPEVQICQTEEIWVRRGVRVNPKAKHRKPSGDIFRRSLDLCLVSPSAVMMTKQLFTQFRGFDESFPVCEDYDLWLRIGVDHPVPLIPMSLVVKRGGHRDQLSHSIWGMDRYRVQSLRKLLPTGLAAKNASG